MNKDSAGFWWNMIGSVIYAVTSMLLGTFVIRTLGGDLGGIFFFAFSTMGQHIYIVSYFGMRPVQITDTARNFSFGDFRKFRILTCALALICACVFAVLYSGLSYKAAVIVVVSLYRILDGLADVYESEFQRDGRLDMTGKSMTIRTLIAVAVFAAVMLTTRNLLLSCAAMVIAIAASVFFLELSALRKLENVDYSQNADATRRLFDSSKWLFISAFIDLYIFAASKYAVDANMSAAASGYYSTIFIPTSVINLMANFVIRPVLTGMSDQYNDGRTAEFKKSIRSIGTLILVLTAIGMLAAWLIGIPCLSLLVGSEAGAEIEAYKAALVIVIAGGGLYAVLNLLYYVLVIIGRQKEMFLVYAGGAVLAFAISGLFVRNWGINGAAVSYLICMLAIVIAFAVIAGININRKKDN